MMRSAEGEEPAPRRSGRPHARLLAACGVLALLLGGCVPAREAAPPPAAASPGDARLGDGPPRFTEQAYIASDGARLPLRTWLPRGRPAAVILALHGFNDYSNAFDIPARRWAARGIATYAYDQRGFGAAPGRGLWAGEGRLALDAVVASWILRRAYPDCKLILLGHSMGGAVALLAATGAMRGVLAGPAGMPAADIDGLVLGAPAVWGRATMDLLPRLALFAGVRLFPDAAVSGQGLRIQASDNLAVLEALGRDPLVLKGARVDAVYGLVDLMDDALTAAPRLTRPLLLLYGAHDALVPRPAMTAFAARLPPTPGRRLAYYPGGYHLLLRDLDGAAVAADVASWIADRRRPLPSHADAAAAARPWPPRQP